MATVPETQALLDELKAPSIITAAQINAGVKNFAPGIGKVISEAGVLARLAQDSEIAEPDDGLRALYGELFQKIGAMRRIGGEMERDTRDIVACMREVADVVQRIRTAAAALGYTI